MQIDEVWHWEAYDNRLFNSFMMKAMKVKVANSGFPKNCITDEQKEAYVKDQNDFYKFDLKVSEVKRNPAMRTLGKNTVTQFWGCFRLHPNK